MSCFESRIVIQNELSSHIKVDFISIDVIPQLDFHGVIL